MQILSVKLESDFVYVSQTIRAARQLLRLLSFSFLFFHLFFSSVVLSSYPLRILFFFFSPPQSRKHSPSPGTPPTSASCQEGEGRRVVCTRCLAPSAASSRARGCFRRRRREWGRRRRGRGTRAGTRRWGGCGSSSGPAATRRVSKLFRPSLDRSLY